jgi:hypothetical protein
VVLFAVILVFGCTDEENNPTGCNPENPFEMPWMQEWIAELQNCACTISIFQAEYNGEPVFWQLMNDPLCQGIIANVAVVNCLGEEIFVLNNYGDWVEFNKLVSDRRIIYACPRIN